MPTKRTRRLARAREPELSIDAAAIRACLIGDEEYFRRVLNLLPWDVNPLMAPGYWDVQTERDQRSVEYRERLLAALATLGGFTHEDLDAGDPRAFARLEALYRRYGLDPDSYLYETIEGDEA